MLRFGDCKLIVYSIENRPLLRFMFAVRLWGLRLWRFTGFMPCFFAFSFNGVAQLNNAKLGIQMTCSMNNLIPRVCRRFKQVSASSHRVFSFARTMTYCSKHEPLPSLHFMSFSAPQTPTHGSFPKYGDPNVDPSIL